MSAKAREQVKNEIIAVLRRWSQESDLNDLDLVESATQALNDYLGEDLLEFTPEDPQPD